MVPAILKAMLGGQCASLRSSSSQATPDDDDTNVAGERREERSCKELV